MDEQEVLNKISEWQSQGMSEDEIDQRLNQMGVISDMDEESGVSFEKGNVTIKMPDMNFDLSDYKTAFEKEPPKPSFFKGKDQIKKKEHKFLLKSDRTYTLDGTERKVRKLSLRDIMRLAKKTQAWAKYLGYNIPEMLVDEFSGRYRFSETLMALFERAFGDYDEELDSPTDFSYSVIEEVARLLNIKQQGELSPEDYLLDHCDPEEVYDAVAVLIAFNQGFFSKVWNNLGPIKNLFSSISGMISNKISVINGLQNHNKSEMSPNLNQE